MRGLRPPLPQQPAAQTQETSHLHRMQVAHQVDDGIGLDAVVVALQDGDQVVITSSPHKARFVRLNDRSYFNRSLMDK